MKDPRAAGRLVVFILLVAGCYRSPMDVIAPDEPGSGVEGTGGTSGTGGTGRGGSGGIMQTTSDPFWTYGGNSGSGGTVSNGGSIGYGGVVSHGGIGGDTSKGGQTTVPTGNIVTFSSGWAQGAMSGAGWVALGPLDKVTSPTCGGAAITSSNPCLTSTTWASSTSLCASGTIPALPTAPSATDYSNNWGIDICANATEPPGGGLGASFRTITISTTGTPTSGWRVIVHRLGDQDDTWYCAFAMSGNAVTLTALNTRCWDGSGDNLTSADVRNIDRVGIQIPSSNSAITLNNLCIGRIVFGT